MKIAEFNKSRIRFLCRHLFCLRAFDRRAPPRVLGGKRISRVSNGLFIVRNRRRFRVSHAERPEKSCFGMVEGIRIKLDLSDIVADHTKYRWIYLNYAKFKAVGDLIDHLKAEYGWKAENVAVNLYLEEPFCLMPWESIRVLKETDLIKVTVRKKKQQNEENSDSSSKSTSDRREETKKVKKSSGSDSSSEEDRNKESPALKKAKVDRKPKSIAKHEENSDSSSDSSSEEDRNEESPALKKVKDQKLKSSSSSSSSSSSTDSSEEIMKTTKPAKCELEKVGQMRKPKRRRKRKRTRNRNKNKLPQKSSPSSLIHAVQRLTQDETPMEINTQAEEKEEEAIENHSTSSLSTVSTPLFNSSTPIFASRPTSILTQAKLGESAAIATAEKMLMPHHQTTNVDSMPSIENDTNRIQSTIQVGRHLRKQTLMESNTQQDDQMKRLVKNHSASSHSSLFAQLFNSPTPVLAHRRTTSNGASSQPKLGASAALVTPEMMLSPSHQTAKDESGTNARNQKNEMRSEQNQLQEGSKISFKVLEMGPDYNPGISALKIGQILHKEGDNVVLRLLVGHEQLRCGGKFELDDQNTGIPQEKSYSWSELIDPKVVE